MLASAVPASAPSAFAPASPSIVSSARSSCHDAATEPSAAAASLPDAPGDRASGAVSRPVSLSARPGRRSNRLTRLAVPAMSTAEPSTSAALADAEGAASSEAPRAPSPVAAPAATSRGGGDSYELEQPGGHLAAAQRPEVPSQTLGRRRRVGIVQSAQHAPVSVTTAAPRTVRTADADGAARRRRSPSRHRRADRRRDPDSWYDASARTHRAGASAARAAAPVVAAAASRPAATRFTTVVRRSPSHPRHRRPAAPAAGQHGGHVGREPVVGHPDAAVDGGERAAV